MATIHRNEVMAMLKGEKPWHSGTAMISPPLRVTEEVDRLIRALPQGYPSPRIMFESVRLDTDPDDYVPTYDTHDRGTQGQNWVRAEFGLLNVVYPLHLEPEAAKRGR